MAHFWISEWLTHIIAFTTVPLDLPIGEELGQWEATELDGMIAIKAGVYWTLKVLGREPTEEEKQAEYFDEKFWLHNGMWYKVGAHYQGFNRGILAPQKIIDAWKHPTKDERIPVESTRFVTMASALANEDLWPEWRTWRTHEKMLDLRPVGKRMNNDSFKETRPYERLVKTEAYVPHHISFPLDASDTVSSAFKLKWMQDEDENFGYEDGIPHEIVDMERTESEL